LFVRGLSWDTTDDQLRAAFSAYGEIEDAAVVTDRVTGRNKGYGFVVFKDMDDAYAALVEPEKDIDVQTEIHLIFGNESFLRAGEHIAI
jgi:RNA recognition motif-containing protein